MDDSSILGEIVGGFAAGLAAIAALLVERALVRRDENQRRFTVTTTRWEPTSLRVEVGYLPDFTHVGLHARVKLLSPTQASLRSLQDVSNPAPIAGRYTHEKAGGVAVDNVQIVRLLRHDNEEHFAGALLIQPPEHATDQLAEARIEVVVRADTGKRLMRRRLRVGPIDELTSFWDK